MDKKDNSIHKVKTVGILGATGIIGELLTELLRQRNFSVLRGSRSLKNGYGTQSVNIDDAVSVKNLWISVISLSTVQDHHCLQVRKYCLLL